MTRRISLLFLIALALPFAAAVASYPLLWNDFSFQLAKTESLIFWDLRLPRYFLAFFVGASLSLAGASFQSLLRNPLADPYILGVSGGAALGYVAAVILGLHFAFFPVVGFLAALASLYLIYRLALTDGVLVTLNLLLTGIIFNSFSFAIILLVNSLAHFHQSQQILYLLLGSIDAIEWSKIFLLGAISVMGFVILFLKSKTLNVLSLGEEEAFHLGVNLKKEKLQIFVITSLLVGASVSLCGLIGFVGLFVPHLMRLAFRADHRILLPACFLGGGIFMVLAEYLASHLFMWESLQTKLPVGVITALIGAPLFVLLLKRSSKA